MKRGSNLPKQEMQKGQLAGMRLSRESEERETVGRRQSIERSGAEEKAYRLLNLYRSWYLLVAQCRIWLGEEPYQHTAYGTLHLKAVISHIAPPSATTGYSKIHTVPKHY